MIDLEAIDELIGKSPEITSPNAIRRVWIICPQCLNTTKSSSFGKPQPRPKDGDVGRGEVEVIEGVEIQPDSMAQAAVDTLQKACKGCKGL